MAERLAVNQLEMGSNPISEVKLKVFNEKSMSMSFQAFSFLVVSSFVCVSAFLVICSANIICSVLCLLLTFVFAAIDFFILELDFFGLLLILIYIGAVIVLFLIAIMLADVRERITLGVAKPFLESSGIGRFMVFVVLLYGFGTLVFGAVQEYPWEIDALTRGYFDWFSVGHMRSNIELLGVFLYTKYAYLTLFAGFILLVALMTAIVLVEHLDEIEDK